jgi:hypothetical protein
MPTDLERLQTTLDDIAGTVEWAAGWLEHLENEEIRFADPGKRGPRSMRNRSARRAGATVGSGCRGREQVRPESAALFLTERADFLHLSVEPSVGRRLRRRPAR